MPLSGLSTHLEVDWIHTQLVGVQVTQSRQGSRQVFQVGCSCGQRISDLLAMSLDLGGAVAHIKVGEVGLGGGEATEHPAGRKGGGVEVTGKQVRSCPLSTGFAVDPLVLTEQGPRLTSLGPPHHIQGHGRQSWPRHS